VIIPATAVPAMMSIVFILFNFLPPFLYTTSLDKRMSIIDCARSISGGAAAAFIAYAVQKACG